MCGIAGLTWQGGEDREALLLQSIGQLKHRGPDDAAIYVDDFVGLTHSRLAIVDVGGGRQPFVVSGRDEILVYNGEIFNYDELRLLLQSKGVELRTHSDTELLYWMLVVFGREAVRRLNGQYAFCFYEPKQRTMLLARDPFGEKPLFYRPTNSGLAFASETKALFAMGVVEPALSLPQVHSLARCWATVPSESPFEGIRQLPPGHSMLVRDGKSDIRSEVVPLANPGAQPDDLGEALSGAVHRRMRSDVPVGLLLSGGLDSSIVGAEMRESVPAGDLNSFSIGFPQPEFDERAHQSVMAERLHSDHVTVESDGSLMADDLEDAVHAAESPSPRLAFVSLYALHREINRNDIRVVLSGEGADEMFFGYDLFSEVFIQDSIRRGQTFEDLAGRIGSINLFMANDPRYHQMVQLKFANYEALSRNQSWNASHSQRGSLAAKFVQLLLPADAASTDAAWLFYLRDRYAGFDDFDVFRRAQIIEAETLLSGHLLSTQGDRISMAHSVETRMPFLDPALAAFSTAQDAPTTFFGRTSEKAVLKDIYRNRLPEQILERKKYPFRAPDSVSLLSTGRGRELVNELAGDLSMLGGVADVEKAEGFLRKCLDAGAPSPRDNFAFVMLVTTAALARTLGRKRAAPGPESLRHRSTTTHGTVSDIEGW